MQITVGTNVFVCGGIISWMSKKQTTVALSSTEAEYVTASLATQEVIWLRALLRDLNFEQTNETLINEDNQETIALSKNPIMEEQSILI